MNHTVFTVSGNRNCGAITCGRSVISYLFIFHSVLCIQCGVEYSTPDFVQSHHFPSSRSILFHSPLYNQHHRHRQCQRQRQRQRHILGYPWDMTKILTKI